MNSTDRLNGKSSIHRFLAVTEAAAVSWLSWASEWVCAKLEQRATTKYTVALCVCTVRARATVHSMCIYGLRVLYRSFCMWLNGFARKSWCRCRCCYIFFSLSFSDFFIVRQIVCVSVVFATLFFQWSDLPVVLSLHITHCRSWCCCRCCRHRHLRRWWDQDVNTHMCVVAVSVRRRRNCGTFHLCNCLAKLYEWMNHNCYYRIELYTVSLYSCCDCCYCCLTRSLCCAAVAVQQHLCI